MATPQAYSEHIKFSVLTVLVNLKTVHTLPNSTAPQTKLILNFINIFLKVSK